MTHRKLLRLLTVGAVLVATGGGAMAANAEPVPPLLRLAVATDSITVDRYPDEGVWLELPTHVVAGAVPFEIKAKRTSYAEPIVARQITASGNRKLPDGLVDTFAGFKDFTHLRIVDAAGNVVVERDEVFCPAGAVRARPDAPATSPYPSSCSNNPFSLGAVWGIQAGWSVPASGSWWDREPLDLADGTYTATITVNPAYTRLFGIPADKSSATVRITVRAVDSGKSLPDAVARAHARAAHADHDMSGTGSPFQPAARPAGKGRVPAGPKPDLRSLPAWGIEIGAWEEEAGRDYLSFNATVWVAGQSALVVDGFRRTGEDVMDAYQYFYDTEGNQAGYAQVGTMEWDAREGHHHWHFTDFAQYRLLDADQGVAVRSGKEAFCLANTDAVDYTLARANWRPENTELRTSCGRENSIATRQVLDVGNGDTYAQYLPGQSFDITDLPNGTYYVEVAANPDAKLYESNRDNNTSLRKVILGGEPGARTVEVPPHDGVSG